MPNDLRVILEYLSKTEVRRIGADLRSDPRDESAGWFVRAYRNEGYDDIVKYTRVTAQDALHIASVIDGQLPQPRGRGSVAAAVQAIQTELDRTRAQRRATAERQLRDAQAALAAIDREADGISVDLSTTD